MAFNSLKEIVEKKAGMDEGPVEKLRTRSILHKLLEEYLFMPCEIYQQMIHHHFYSHLTQALRKYAPGFELNQLVDKYCSLDFKFALFRYQFCDQLKSVDVKRQFEDRIIYYARTMPVP